MRIFFDESGFTGEDLANSDQPLFVLASNQASDAVCENIYRDVFSGVQSKELKHSTLVRTAAGRRRILEFLEAIRGQDMFATWIVHKEFCLLTKFVDLWVEPALRKLGTDLYERGANIAFANMAYICLRTFESPAFMSKHLAAFQQMVRLRTSHSYVKFWRGLGREYNGCRKDSQGILDFFFRSEQILGPQHLINLPERTLDICLTSALQATTHWRGKTDESLEVIHDKSSSMAKEKWMWDAITSPDVPRIKIASAELKGEYPLRVIHTHLANSKSHLQLQFADIVAGASVAWGCSLLSNVVKDQYSTDLHSAGISEHLLGGIWPTTSVEPIELEAGSVSANEYIDFVARILGDAIKRRPPDPA